MRTALGVLSFANPHAMDFLESIRRFLFGATNKDILMKLTEVKAQIAAAAARSTEAFAEISNKITTMQTQIDDLIAGATDPDVTDEAFLANLQALKTTTDQLADIVPEAPTPPAPSQG